MSNVLFAVTSVLRENGETVQASKDTLTDHLTEEERAELLCWAKEVDGGEGLTTAWCRAFLHRHNFRFVGTVCYSFFSFSDILQKMASRLVGLWAFMQAAEIPLSNIYNTDQCLNQRFDSSRNKWVLAGERGSVGPNRQASKEAFTCVTTTRSDGTLGSWQTVIKSKAQSGELTAHLTKKLEECGMKNPEGMLLGVSQNGWQSKQNLQDLWNKSFPQESSACVLLLDNLSMFQDERRLHELEDKGVFCFFGPAALTGVWQPNDLWLHSFIKQGFREHCSRWIETSEGQATTNGGNLRSPDSVRCAAFMQAIRLSIARDPDKKETIRKTFLQSGWALPFDGSQDKRFLSHIVNSNSAPDVDKDAADTKKRGRRSFKERQAWTEFTAQKEAGTQVAVDKRPADLAQYLVDCREAAALLSAELKREHLDDLKGMHRQVSSWIGIHYSCDIKEILNSLKTKKISLSADTQKKGAGTQDFYVSLSQKEALEKDTARAKNPPAFRTKKSSIIDLLRASAAEAKRKRDDSSITSVEVSVDQSKASTTKKDHGPGLQKETRTVSTQTQATQNETGAGQPPCQSAKDQQVTPFTRGYWLGESDLDFIITLTRTRDCYHYFRATAYDFWDGRNFPNMARWCSIINTRAANETGLHWVLLVSNLGSIQVVDPMNCTPLAVIQTLKQTANRAPFSNVDHPELIRTVKDTINTEIQKDSWTCGYLCAWWAVQLGNMTSSSPAYDTLPDPSWYSAPPANWVDEVHTFLKYRVSARKVGLNRQAPNARAVRIKPAAKSDHSSAAKRRKVDA